MSRSRTGLALALAALPLATLPVAARAQAITGAGSTFAAPIYGKWAEASHAATGVSLNYQAIGSGGGQNQVFNRTVDFGASDAPVAADKLASNSLLQFPAAMGGVDVIVNIPGVEGNKLRYMDSVVCAWHDAGITDVSQVQLLKKAPAKDQPKQVRAQQYTQRQYTDADLAFGDSDLMKEAAKQHG